VKVVMDETAPLLGAAQYARGQYFVNWWLFESHHLAWPGGLGDHCSCQRRLSVWFL